METRFVGTLSDHRTSRYGRILIVQSLPSGTPRVHLLPYFKEARERLVDDAVGMLRLMKARRIKCGNRGFQRTINHALKTS